MLAKNRKYEHGELMFSALVIAMLLAEERKCSCRQDGDPETLQHGWWPAHPKREIGSDQQSKNAFGALEKALATRVGLASRPTYVA